MVGAGARVRVAVVGPTATGKSDLALDLIEALGEGAGSEHPAQVVNADASQLYRGMDIGTAKLSVAERRGVPHHQIDVLDVREEASVAAYQRAARRDMARIEAAGGRVVLVGGSGLYARAVTDALEFPGTDAAVRADLQERAAAEGTRALYAELRERDPLAAERIEPSNTRRIVRALEAIAVTGRPFSASMPRHEDLAPTVHLALRPDRDALNARINARCCQMFASGLLEETEALLGAGLRQGPTASRAIGYSQAVAVLEGTMGVEEAVEATALATRQLASRQIKWFRRDPRITWVDVRLHGDGTWAAGERQRVTRLACQAVRAAQDRAADLART